jgi:hypothetical protein
MILQETDNYIKACMKTWMFCEACIHTEEDADKPRQLLIQKCRICASSCFSVVCRIINDSGLLQESVLNCLLNCHECFEECEKYDDIEDIQYCGEVCRSCEDSLKELLLQVNLN